MALTATMRRFEIALSDSDRALYEQIDLRVAQHPSESERYLVCRVLARALEHVEGLEFSRGLSSEDEPALWRRSPHGEILLWIDIGAPSTKRLHKASKTGARVVIFTWKGGLALAEAVRESVHRAQDIEIYEFSGDFLDGIATTLERTNRWEISVVGGVIYVGSGQAVFEGAVQRISIPT